MKRLKIKITVLFLIFVVLQVNAQIDPPQINELGFSDFELEKIKGNVKNVHVKEFYGKDYFGEIIKSDSFSPFLKILFNEKNQIFDIEGVTNQGILLCFNVEYKIEPLLFERTDSGFTFNLIDSTFENIILKTIWRYDNNRNIIEYVNYNVNDDNNTILKKEIASYKSNNKLTEYKRYSSDGTIEEYNTFIYDLNGKITEEIENSNGNYKHKKSIYNIYGKIIEELFYDKNEELYFKYNYKYDMKGNIAEKLSTSYKNSKSYTTRTIYQYNNYGKIIMLDEKSKRHKPEDSSVKEIFKYDSYNRLVEVFKYSQFQNEEIKFISRKLNNYNSTGKLIEKIEIRYGDYNKEDWKDIEKFDSNGNLIEETHINNGSDEPYRSVTKFEYDVKGNWIKKIYYSIDLPKTLPDNYHITERIITYRK
jgi:hypothetical protein